MSRPARRVQPAPTPAKFSRPRLYNVQYRERLFLLLDAHRAHPMTWIAGPPGSGKPTLVASYVDARKLPGVRFQADPGDADPETFCLISPHHPFHRNPNQGTRKCRPCATF